MQNKLKEVQILAEQRNANAVVNSGAGLGLTDRNNSVTPDVRAVLQAAGSQVAPPKPARKTGTVDTSGTSSSHGSKNPPMINTNFKTNTVGTLGISNANVTPPQAIIANPLYPANAGNGGGGIMSNINMMGPSSTGGPGIMPNMNLNASQPMMTTGTPPPNMQQNMNHVNVNQQMAQLGAGTRPIQSQNPGMAVDEYGNFIPAPPVPEYFQPIDKGYSGKSFGAPALDEKGKDFSYFAGGKSFGKDNYGGGKSFGKDKDFGYSHGGKGDRSSASNSKGRHDGIDLYHQYGKDTYQQQGYEQVKGYDAYGKDRYSKGKQDSYGSGKGMGKHDGYGGKSGKKSQSWNMWERTGDQEWDKELEWAAM